MGSQGLQQVQKQTQQLVLAPQLRQSLKILQAPALELRNTIVEELQTNPALEELIGDGVSLEAQAEESMVSQSDVDHQQEMEFTDADYSILNQMDEDWREHFSQDNASSYSSDQDEKRKHFFDSIVSETSLQEHLMRQADLTDISAVEKQALEYLIGSLDDNGFVTVELSEIAVLSGLDLDVVQRASKVLKTFEPVGIGCKDLSECLLQQLKASGRSKSLAARIIREHYNMLLRRRIPEMARKMGVDSSEVQRAIGEISDLDPSPGRKFSEDNNRIIVPDVRVEWDGSKWLIHLNNEYIPRLRISQTYKQMIAKGQLSAQEKEYIREKMRSGKFLISSIEQRQNTLERITQEILDFQNDFFDQGVSGLKPLTMNQVAERVGVHETTVSRAIANKYLETPHGVFEFKYFFTSGYQNVNGGSVSNTSVKELIANIIENEDPGKPLSDQSIVNQLKEKEVSIARRTVAKYREELGILPTNLRRRYDA